MADAVSPPDPDQSRADELDETLRWLEEFSRRAQRVEQLDPVSAEQSRRSMFRALLTLAAGWALVVAVDVILIRAHVWGPTDAGVATGAGAVAGMCWFPIWFGWSGRAHFAVRDGHAVVTARTISGVRTVDLDRLVRVRRFSAMARSGSLDEYHLTDAHGVRLSIDITRFANAVDKTVREGLERSSASRPGGADPKVTRHARSALGLEPRSRLPQVLHMFWGVWMMIGMFGIPAIASYVLALQLSGSSVWTALTT